MSKVKGVTRTSEATAEDIASATRKAQAAVAAGGGRVSFQGTGPNGETLRPTPEAEDVNPDIPMGGLPPRPHRIPLNDPEPEDSEVSYPTLTERDLQSMGAGEPMRVPSGDGLPQEPSPAAVSVSDPLTSLDEAAAFEIPDNLRRRLIHPPTQRLVVAKMLALLGVRMNALPERVQKELLNSIGYDIDQAFKSGELLTMWTNMKAMSRGIWADEKIATIALGVIGFAAIKTALLDAGAVYLEQ